MSEDRGEALRSRLQAADRPRHWPNQRPRDAATLIIVDKRAATPKILMGRRHDGHKFMPGKFVFPGGRIEAHDRIAPSVSDLSAATQAALDRRVTRRSSGRARALALAAIRETCEETGLLLGRKVEDQPASRAGGEWVHFRERAILPDLARMMFIGRAITPPRRPKRFDTRFFCVDREAIAAEIPGRVGPDSELVELAWVGLPEARRLDLPSITSIMLDELEDRLSGRTPSDGPVPFYRELRGRFVRELV